MRYHNTRRKASDTPMQVQDRVLSSITSFLQRHGCTFETDGHTALVIHRPDITAPAVVSFRAYYGDEQARYVLVEVVIDGRKQIAGERSATQRLYNHCHTIVNEWAENIGVTA